MSDLREWWRRRRVGLAFVIMAALMVVLLAVLVDQLGQVRHLARQNRRATIQLQANAAQIKATNAKVAAEQAARVRLRDKQIKALDEFEKKTCRSTHKLVGVIEGIVNKNIAQAKQEKFPGLTPEQEKTLARDIRRGIASSEAAVRALKGADCLAAPKVPQLPPVRAHA